MSNNTRLAELMNYITIDTTSGTQLQVSGSVKQTSVTSALMKAGSTGILLAAVAGTDYLTSVGISNLTATGTPSSTTYLRGDNTWATVSAGASSVSTLTDVVITSVANGDVLQYNSSTSKWVNAALSFATLNTAQTFTAVKTFQAASDAPVAAGSELLSTATAATGWSGTNWSTGFTSSGGSTQQPLNFTASALTFYKVTITCTGFTTGLCQVFVGSFAANVTGNGTQTVYHYPTGTSLNYITPLSGFVGTVVVSIKVATPSVSPVVISNSTSNNLIEFRMPRSQGNTNSLHIGYNSGAFGYQAANNTAIGENTLYTNISGTFNIAIGDNALYGGQGGVTQQYNVAIGARSMYSSVTANSSVGVGSNTLENTTAASYNVAIGTLAMQSANNSANNVAIGYLSLANNTSGGNNVAIGYQSGKYISGGATSVTGTTGSIYIGYNAYPLANSQTNQIVIGTSSVGLGSNTTVLGNSSTVDTAIYGNLLLGNTTTGGAYKLNVTGSTLHTNTSAMDTITFGTSITPSTGWSALPANWSGTFATGYSITAGGGTLNNTYSFPAISYYQVSITATGVTVASTFYVYLNGNGAFFNVGTGTNTYILYVAVGVAGTPLQLQAGSALVGTISNILIQPISNTISPNLTLAGSSGTVGKIEFRIPVNANYSNIYIGNQSGVISHTAYANIGLGENSLNRNVTGQNNVAIGLNSMYYTQESIQNVSVGISTMQNLYRGSLNLAIGHTAMYNCTNVNYNSIVGAQSLYTSTGAQHTSTLGWSTLNKLTSGSYNSVIGSDAASNLTTSSYCVILGYQAAKFISGGATNATVLNNSIIIGSNSYPLADSQTNQIVIGYATVGLGSNTTVLGNSSTTLTALYGAVITGGTSADASAQLQIDSTTKGVLFPRMTTTQKNAITSPAAGLVIYDTTLNKLCVRVAAAWETITSA